jgi:hypothetical protein
VWLLSTRPSAYAYAGKGFLSDNVRYFSHKTVPNTVISLLGQID